MKKISFLTFVVNCVAWLTSLFRICTNQDTPFDYFVVFFTFTILVCDIYRIVKAHKKKQQNKKAGEPSPDDQ